jgi:signal transduction histidine kinase
LGNLAHELRTPIQVLVGYLDILRDEFVAEFSREPRDIIERMNSNVHDLAHTIDNLMEFVLTQANEEQSPEEDVGVSSLLAEIMPKLEAANARKQLKMRFEIKDAPTEVRAPRRALRSIILNLMLNAIKFTDAGTVMLTLRRARGAEAHEALEIEVSDTGPGLSHTMLEQALQPFAQLSKSSARRHRGIGLGLTLVRQQVAALDGKLELRSTPDRGSTFIVQIPSAIRDEAVVVRPRRRGATSSTLSSPLAEPAAATVKRPPTFHR